MVKESEDISGQWELPGGGLDFGEDLRAGLEREVEEEMKLDVISVSDQPIYVWTTRLENSRDMDWYYSVVLGYKIEFANLDFTPTDECVEVKFFDKKEIQSLDLHHKIAPLCRVFDPADFE